MRAPLVEVLDVRQSPVGRLEAASERWTAASPPVGSAVLWGAQRCPRGWKAVGNGVAFLAPGEWEVVRTTIRLDELGPNKIFYQDRAHESGMVLIVLLPEGVVASSAAGIRPAPDRVKSYKGRMAALWKLQETQTDVVCEVAPAPAGQIERAAETISADLHAEGHQPFPGSSQVKETEPVEKPYNPTDWLLLAARRIPVMVYAIGVVGIAATAALSIGFFLGQWLLAVFGVVGVIAAMIIVRIFATSKMAARKIDTSQLVRVLFWTCVLAFVVLVGMGLVSFGIFLFGPRASGSPSTGTASAPSTATASAPAITTSPQVSKNEVKLDLKGIMSSRRDGDVVSFKGIAKSPATVTIEPDQEYQFLFIAPPTDVELAQLKVFKDAPLHLYVPQSDRIGDTGMEHLAQLNGLRALSLLGCRWVTDRGLANLRKMPNLESVWLTGNDQITDNGMEYLAELKGLKQLSLFNCKRVTDDGARRFKSHTGLKSIILKECGVTDAGIDELRKALPACKVNGYFQSI